MTMSNFYDDSKFGVINRQWFFLSKKWGGSVPMARVASGKGCFGTTDATSKTHLAKWYPRGPVKMLKAGVMTLASVTNASVDRIPVRITTRGASASAGCSFYISGVPTVQAEISSTTTFTVSQVKAGEYIAIKTGTPQTDNGTAANTATTLGTVAFFIDYVPTWDTSKHDVSQ
jgi:hypothetical protein